MNHLVHVEQKEIVINFELGRKCKTTLHIRNLMHTMPVAFKLQTTSPRKFCVKPPNGYVLPLSERNIDIILKPQKELPSCFPFSAEKFVLKTALAHITNENSVLPECVPNGWFSSPQTRVFIDAKLKVVYIGASLLRHCVAREDERGVGENLKRHIGPCVADENGRTALHIAASTGNFKLIDMLLEYGAEINAMDGNGRTPLWEAVWRGQVNVVEGLLKRGAHIEVNEALKKAFVAPIQIATTLPSTEILKQLIESGANLETKDQEGQTAVRFAERLENWKVLQAGANKNARGDGRTPLLIAPEKGLLDAAQLLLEGDASMPIKPENGHTPSEVAYGEGHVAVIQALNAGEELLRAARQGDGDAVATLLQHRASKRSWIKDSAGWTPLHVAAFKGHVEIVRRLLLEEGGKAALQVGDVEGHTPLHCGAEGGSIEVVELLLAMGADPLAASSRGATPADLADALGFNTIAKLIQHHASISNTNDLTNGKCLLGPLHRQPKSTGPNLTPFDVPSTTDTSHKETVFASSVRFSTPTKLHQNSSSKQSISSLLNRSSRAPEDVISYSSRSRQNLTLQWNQGAITSEGVKLMQTPASTGLSDSENADESTPVSSPLMSSMAMAEPTHEVSTTAHLADVQHAANTPIIFHKSGFTSISQAVQNMIVAQSQQSQPREEGIATPQQPNTQDSDVNLRISHQQYTTERDEGLNKSPQTLQVHSKTDGLNADVDGVALENSLVPLQPQCTREVDKSLTFITPRCEAQPQFIYKGMEDLGLCKQSSTVSSASPAAQKMAHVNKIEVINDSTSRKPSVDSKPKVQMEVTNDATLSKSLVDSKPQVLMVEKLGNTISQGHQKPTSMQLQPLIEDRSVDIKSMPIDKFTLQLLSTHESINSLELNKQHRPSASLCCKQENIRIVEDKPVRSFVDRAHLPESSSRIHEGSPANQTSCSMPSSLSYSISPELCKQSEHDIQLSSTSSDPVIATSWKMNGNNSIPTFQAISSVYSTEKLEDTTSLKPTCKVSSIDQNGPIYTPPLRIKQMKKPASTPILRSSNWAQDGRNETLVAESAAGIANPTKPKRRIFREILEQSVV